MEAARAHQEEAAAAAAVWSRGGLLGQILPPRIEDAGLEDCALPPESIKEAFFKAASAVKSRAASVLDAGTEYKEGAAGCVDDPWPEETGKATDDVVGISPDPSAAGDLLVGLGEGKEKKGPCVGEKGGGVVEEGRDKVVFGGGDVEEMEEGKKGCVEIGEEEGRGTGGDEEEGKVGQNEGGERPTLTEGFV